ncbi:hypothetical protein [Fodinicola acaciae]|uniref:hypothetical protein n=1 Tax=Fodinicola acaciae TaxID=2681555 RepID=UPI0013D02F86|nr:hypothetical protein [Fodinicola acaciae]
MRTTGYAYSWDVTDDPGFSSRVADLGVDRVAVAAAYHSARAGTPWQRDRTAVAARTSAIYRPVREKVWRNRRLRPAAATWTGQEDSAGAAIRALSGVTVDAWIVLTHNSQLGESIPDFAVTNCFGETYPWGLCPSRPEVVDYAATLAVECVDGLELAGVILEACGQLGAVHQSRHEKTDAIWSPAAARLMSICCCAGCAAAWQDEGRDPAAVRAEIRDEVLRLVALGDVTVTTDRLCVQLSEMVLRKRQKHVDELRQAVVDALPSGLRLTLHADPDPWTTGALVGLTPDTAKDVDAVVVPAWQPGERALDAVRAADRAVTENGVVGAYVTAVAAARVPDIASYVDSLGDAGAGELHLYHLGLAGPARWDDVRAAVTAAKRRGSTTAKVEK